MMDAFERAAAREQDIRRRRRGQRKAQEKRTGLRVHATVAVQLLLVCVWALTGAGYPWFLYPLFGWGIGLVAHYAAVRDRIRDRPSSND